MAGFASYQLEANHISQSHPSVGTRVTQPLDSEAMFPNAAPGTWVSSLPGYESMWPTNRHQSHQSRARAVSSTTLASLDATAGSLGASKLGWDSRGQEDLKIEISVPFTSHTHPGLSFVTMWMDANVTHWQETRTTEQRQEQRGRHWKKQIKTSWDASIITGRRFHLESCISWIYRPTLSASYSSSLDIESQATRTLPDSVWKQREKNKIPDDCY